MHLNLTVIVITNKISLDQTSKCLKSNFVSTLLQSIIFINVTPSIGISNIEAPANKLGTIKEAVCPISCSFDAYRSREVYRDVSSICNSV